MSFVSRQYRIYPNKNQLERIETSFKHARFVYNKALEGEIEQWKAKETFFPLELRSLLISYPFLSETDPRILQNSLDRLAYGLTRCRKDGVLPKYHSKDRARETISYPCSSFFTANGRIALRRYGRVKINLHRPFPSDGKLYKVTITKNPGGKYFLGLCFRVPDFPLTEKAKSYLGLDYSLSSFIVTSEGKSFPYPHSLLKMEDRLNAHQSRLSKMQKGGKNHKEETERIGALYEKIWNVRKDFLNKVASFLSKRYDRVCVESLNLLSMGSKERRMGRQVRETSYAKFLRILEFHLRKEGKVLIKVDRFFPSSQRCHRCGYIDKRLKDPGIKQWQCPHCHATHHRDVNAAINIKMEGMRLDSNT